MDKKLNFKPNGFAQWARFFIDRYRVTILLLVAVVIAGYFGVTDIPKQDFPNIPANMVLVNAVYPGAAAGDVEQEVIIPLENKIYEVEGIKTLRSTAANSYGNIFIEFEDFKNLDQRVSDIENKTSEANLPAKVEVQVDQVDVTGPTVAYVLSSAERSRTEILEMTPAVVNYLESVSPEIKTVEVLPTSEMEIQVSLDESKLARYRLTKEVVVEAIKSATTAFPGGVVRASDGREKPIVIESPVQSLDDFKKIAIGPIKLSDIADIERVAVDDTFTIAGYINGDGTAKSTEAIYLLATKKSDGDVLRVSDAVKKAVDEIHGKNIVPEDVELNLVFDTSPFVRSLISDLAENGWQGLIIILVVLLFFVNLRAGFLVALVLPISFLITWAVMPLLGYTLNILTLFAMILSLGMLVDNAIVIASGMIDNLKRGMNRYAAALKSVHDYGAAILAATVTTVIALIPYALMGGIMGEFFKYIPITLSIMLAVSYFLAISITPLFGTWMLHAEDTTTRRAFKRWEKILVLPMLIYYAQHSVDLLVNWYYKSIRKILTTKKGLILSIVIPALLLIVSFGYYLPRLPFSQFPTMDGEQLTLTVKFPTGTPTEEKNDTYRQIGEKILTIPHFESYFFWQGSFMIFVTEPKARPDDMTSLQIGDDLDQKVDELRRDGQIIAINSQTYGPPAQEFDVIVELASSNSDGVTRLVDDLEKFTKEQDGVDRTLNGPKDLLTPSVGVELDATKLAQKQSSAVFASMAINSVFSESDAGKVVVRADGVSDKIVVVYRETARDSTTDLKSVPVVGATTANPSAVTRAAATPAKLSDVAKVGETDRLDTISRLNRERVGAFKVKMAKGGDKAALEQKIKDYLTEDKLGEYGLEPDDIVYGGEYASVMETTNNLQIVLIIAMLLVYLVIVYQFNSYGEPFIIMLTIPMGLIGVFPALVWIGSTLDMVSGLGIIALVGIVVNNAIILIDYYNRVKRANPQLSLAQTLAETGRGRIKPILSTTITTIGGIIPLTINDPFWTGLGTTLIAGLVCSSFGSLVVVPVLIYLFTRRKKRGVEKPWRKITALDDLTGQVQAAAEEK